MKKKMNYEERIEKNLKIFRSFLQIDKYNIDNEILPCAAEYIDNVDNFHDEEDRQNRIKYVRKIFNNFDIEKDKYQINSDNADYYNQHYRCYKGATYYRKVVPFIWAWAQCVHIMEMRKK